MKKILLFMTAALTFAAVSCSDEPKDDAPAVGDGELAAPEVSFKSVTATTFTAEWPAVKGASSYRYEVTYLVDGHKVAVAAKNITETTFSLDALRPSTEYIVRVVAKEGEKMSPNWFTGTVTTSGGAEVKFEVTPYEAYFEKEGYVYPYAKVEASNPDVYYWVSAVPVERLDKPKDWVEEDIAYYTDLGITWEELVEERLILKGSAESSPFLFEGYNHFHFVVAPVEKTLDGIGISGELALSYQFWCEGVSTPMIHKSTYDTYVGDWVLQTYGIVRDMPGDEGLKVVEGESFPVKIAANPDKKSWSLTGWGGSRNKYSSAPLVIDFVPDNDGTESPELSISFPQEIKKEGEIVWKYASWYNFHAKGSDGSEINRYLPFDDKMAEAMPSWKVGFRGFVGNINQTVIKIFPNEFIDPNNGEGAEMMAIWPYGISTTGDSSKDKFLNDEYEHPASYYFLTRKDVADGKKMPLQETHATDEQALAADVTPLVSKTVEGRVFRRLCDDRF